MLGHCTIFVSKMTMLFHERPLMGLRTVLKTSCAVSANYVRNAKIEIASVLLPGCARGNRVFFTPLRVFCVNFCALIFASRCSLVLSKGLYFEYYSDSILNQKRW